MFLAHIQILAHIQNKYNTFWSVNLPLYSEMLRTSISILLTKE